MEGYVASVAVSEPAVEVVGTSRQTLPLVLA
jgi:hypothetical protein